MAAFIERLLENVDVIDVDPSLRFKYGIVENLLDIGVGIEWFAFLDPDRLERIDHCLVAFQPWLSLYEAIKRLKESQVVGDRVIEYDVDNVDELCWRRIGRL